MAIQVISEHVDPPRPERKLMAPQWVLEGPTRAIVMELDQDGMLYRHQSIGLEKLHSPDANLVISTGTASGKTLIFQIATLDRLLRNPEEGVDSSHLPRWTNGGATLERGQYEFHLQRHRKPEEQSRIPQRGHSQSQGPRILGCQKNRGPMTLGELRFEAREERVGLRSAFLPRRACNTGSSRL